MVFRYVRLNDRLYVRRYVGPYVFRYVRMSLNGSYVCLLVRRPHVHQCVRP